MFANGPLQGKMLYNYNMFVCATFNTTHLGVLFLYAI